MLTLDGGKANAAPSIWSFDSGYGSGDAGRRNSAFYQQASTSSNSLEQRLEDCAGLGLSGLPSFYVGEHDATKKEEPTIDPSVTQLSVFTTHDTDNNGFRLPEITSGREGCLKCELWRISKPRENVRCDECRLPEIIEPSLLSKTSAKKPFTRTLSTHARCSACELSAIMDPTGATSCATCTPCSPNVDLLSPISPLSPTSSEYRVRRSRAGRNGKLPQKALSRLQAWLDAHQENPYPTADDKRQLARDCEITEKQVTTWFTNARARRLSPLDTGLSSGSEDEGATPSDIFNVTETPVYYTGGFSYLADATGTPRQRRAGSVSESSVAGQAGPQPSRRGKKKNYRRFNQPPINEHASPLSDASMISPMSPEQEVWQCTFCRRQLVPKSWRRHEETQHRPRAQWTCMLYGPRLPLPQRTNSGSCCAFCMQKNPSEEHFLHSHRINECAKRPIAERTFFRPDHLRQHVKNFHNATLFDNAQTRWKKMPGEEKEQRWICGFCEEELETWDQRETHIAGHFKEGMTMAQWTDYAVPSKVSKKKKKGNGLVSLGKRLTGRSTKNSLKDTAEMHDHCHSNAHAFLTGQESQFLPSTSVSQVAAFQTTTYPYAYTQPPPAYQMPTSHPQQHYNFANAFSNISISAATSTCNTPLPLTHSHDQTHTYSAPPVLPAINQDPLMGNYNAFDWNNFPMGNMGTSAYSTTQPADTMFTQMPTASLGGTMFAPNAEQAFDGTIDDVLRYSNNVQYQGPWDEQQEEEEE